MVKSSHLISLFAPPSTAPRTGPSAFVVSTLVHCVVFGLMLIAIKNAPNMMRRVPDQRYTVRILRLQGAEPQLRWRPSGGGVHPAVQAVAHAMRSGGQLAAPAAPRQTAPPSQSLQTLIQPNTPPNQPLIKETPVPTIVMWRPEITPTLKIIPTPHQEVTAAHVPPSLALPNRESHISDIELASSSSASNTIPIPASTTTPVAVPLPVLQTVPESASKSAGQPTPTTVVSVSDVLVAQGTVALPLANETASGSASDSVTPGRPESTGTSGNGLASGQQNANGVGQNADGRGGTRDGGAGESAESGDGGNRGNGTGPGTASNTGSNSGSMSGVDRITLPRNGRYSIVVVGASLDSEYPDTLGIWAGRLAYTVYVHVGLAKNWILQYSVPQAPQASANSAYPRPVNTTRPDAPWPYVMVRPHLTPTDSDSDAIMVHGFINSGGHFEQLAVVFPPQFAQAKFVLGALQQWEFRPAMEKGQLTAVEVLLIIPSETD